MSAGAIWAAASAASRSAGTVCARRSTPCGELARRAAPGDRHGASDGGRSAASSTIATVTATAATARTPASAGRMRRAARTGGVHLGHRRRSPPLRRLSPLQHERVVVRADSISSSPSSASALSVDGVHAALAATGRSSGRAWSVDLPRLGCSVSHAPAGRRNWMPGGAARRGRRRPPRSASAPTAGDVSRCTRKREGQELGELAQGYRRRSPVSSAPFSHTSSPTSAWILASRRRALGTCSRVTLPCLIHCQIWEREIRGGGVPHQVVDPRRAAPPSQ
jgi:hypothetical protein